MRQWCRYLLALLCLLCSSCAHIEQLKMQQINEECEKTVKDYNKLLRWREIENAGMLYMDRSLRDEFLKGSEDFKKRGVIIVDHRILTTECLAEKKSADVVVEYDYYVPPSNRVKTLTYRQDWRYLDADGTKGWQLKTVLPLFE